MIVPSKNDTWFSLLFRIQGTIFLQIKYRILSVVLLSVIVSYVHEIHFVEETFFSVTPFSLIGLALSIFLGFRNNTSYDRFWEGRKLWGGLINNSRTTARRIDNFISPAGTEETRKSLIYQTIAYIHCLRMHLRNEWHPEQLQDFLSKEQIEALTPQLNKPIALLHLIGKQFQALHQEKLVNTYHLPLLEDALTQFANLQGGCERIKATPIPFSYNVLLHRIVAIYCFSLPFGLVSITGWGTPLVTALFGYAFLGIDAIGTEIEEPFGYDQNDLPLDALTTMIEVNLREQLGERGDLLPALKKPDSKTDVLT